PCRDGAEEWPGLRLGRARKCRPRAAQGKFPRGAPSCRSCPYPWHTPIRADRSGSTSATLHLGDPLPSGYHDLPVEPEGGAFRETPRFQTRPRPRLWHSAHALPAETLARGRGSAPEVSVGQGRRRSLVDVRDVHPAAPASSISL